jgi:hypothetical protein
VDVVDVLGALTVGEVRVEDHNGPAVHDEANLLPEGTVEALGEIRKHLFEELPGERDVVDGSENRRLMLTRS